MPLFLEAGRGWEAGARGHWKRHGMGWIKSGVVAASCRRCTGLRHEMRMKNNM
jgi:hypothetical protein